MCDDSTNNDACGYDGGDCCGNSVNDQYCNECICHESGDTSNTNYCPDNVQLWVGDTFCDDAANIAGMLIVKQKILSGNYIPVPFPLSSSPRPHLGPPKKEL